MWLHQVSLYNDSDCRVVVISEVMEPEEIKEWHNLYQFSWQRLKSKRKQYYPLLKRLIHRFSGDIESYRITKTRLKVLNHHNVRFKLYHLSKWPNPFIFLDVDAILFGPISELVKASVLKPFIAVNHQEIPKHTEGKPPYLNGGVQIVSQPGYFTFEDFSKDTDSLFCPGHEQALIYTTFKNLNYDYTHPKIGFEWNACSGFNEVVKQEDGSWKCYSRGYLINDETKKTDSIPAGVEILVNHYWDEFKPWKVNCPMYEEFMNIVVSKG